MANDIITNLHPDNDPSTNLYPNIKKENIPSKSISTDKLDDNVLSLIGSLKPSGTDTSANILAYTSNKGIYVATDNGHWYYWNGSAYTNGGVYQSSEDIEKIKEDLSEFQNTTFDIRQRVNLANPTEFVMNKTMAKDGTIIENAGGFYTGLIKISKGEKLAFGYFSASSNTLKPLTISNITAFAHDGNTVVLEGGFNNEFSGNVYECVLDNVGYIRISSYAHLIPIQAEYTILTEYEPYIQQIQPLLKDDCIPKIIDRLNIAESNIQSLKQSSTTEWKRKDHRVKLPVFVSTTSNDAKDWSLSGGTKENSIYTDTVNDYSNYSCVSFESNSNDRITSSLSAPIDATKYPILIMLNQHRKDDALNYQSLNVELYSGNSFDEDHRAEAQVLWASGTHEWNDLYVRKGALYLCNFIEAMCTTKGASFDATNVTGVGFHLFHNSGSKRGIDIVKCGFVEPMLRGGCITVVDNFNLSVPKMCDYAYSKGVRLNVSVIPNSIDGDNGIVSASKEELARIAKQGHCIINHTFNHNSSPTLSNIEVFDEITKAINWLDANGYVTGASIVSVPSAALPTAKADAFIDSSADAIYHIWTKDNSSKVSIPYYPVTRMLDISQVDNNPQTAIQADNVATSMIANVNLARDKKGICVNGFHGTFWDADNGVAWKKYIDGIASISDMYHYGIDDIINGRFV